MNRRLLLAVAGWLFTAVVATATGIAVIGLLGRTLAGGTGDVLSAREADEALARVESSPRPSRPSAVPSSPPASSPEATPAPSAEVTTPPPVATPAPEATPAAVSRVITTRGGSVVARCEGGRVTLRSWSPAQGYVVDDVDPGPDDSAQVKFERGDDEDEVEIEVRCSAEGPVHTVEYG